MDRPIGVLDELSRVKPCVAPGVLLEAQHLPEPGALPALAPDLLAILWTEDGTVPRERLGQLRFDPDDSVGAGQQNIEVRRSTAHPVRALPFEFEPGDGAGTRKDQLRAPGTKGANTLTASAEEE